MNRVCYYLDEEKAANRSRISASGSVACLCLATQNVLENHAYKLETGHPLLSTGSDDYLSF